MSEEHYEEQVDVIADALQETVIDQTQQSDLVLDNLATFFTEVANVSTDLNISSQVNH